MNDLTKTQRLVLLSACDHELGLATRPAKLKGASAAQIVSSLTERGFAREVRAKDGTPIWREEEGRGYALKILKAGRDAVAQQITEKMPPEPEAPAAQSSLDRPAMAGPKGSLIVGLMRRKEGASIEALIKATGWLPHTTRAALSGLRKKGIMIERSVPEQGGGSIYRVLDTIPSARTA